MSLQLISAPAAEPVSLTEAKAWLRVESGGDEDDLIAALIRAARIRCEWHVGRAFVTQSWTLWLDTLGDGTVALPLPPLQSVNSVTLYDSAGNATLLDPGAWSVDAPGGRVLFAALHPDLRATNAAAIVFTAGYGDASAVPAPIKSAILQTISWLYEHRGGDAAPLPGGALALLAPYRPARL